MSVQIISKKWKNTIIKLSKNSCFVILIFATMKFRNFSRSAFRRSKFWPRPIIQYFLSDCEYEIYSQKYIWHVSFFPMEYISHGEKLNTIVHIFFSVEVFNPFTPKFTSTWYFLVQLDVPRFIESPITNQKLK